MIPPAAPSANPVALTAAASAVGLELVADGTHEMAEKPVAQLRSGERAVTLALGGQVTTNAASAKRSAGAVAQRRRDDAEPGAAAVGAAEPEFCRCHREGRGEGVVLAGLGQEVGGSAAEQRLRGPAEHAPRRDEGKAASRVGLPGEIAGDLDQILVTLPALDQRLAQIACQGRVMQQRQHAPLLGQRQQQQLGARLGGQRHQARAGARRRGGDPGQRAAQAGVGLGQHLAARRIGRRSRAVAAKQQRWAGEARHRLCRQRQAWPAYFLFTPCHGPPAGREPAPPRRHQPAACQADLGES